MYATVRALGAALLFFASSGFSGTEESPTRFEFAWDYRPVGGDLQTIVLERLASSEGTWEVNSSKQSAAETTPRTELIISGATCEHSPIDIACQSRDGLSILRVFLSSESETRVSIFLDTVQPDYSLRRRSLGRGLLQLQPSRTLSAFVTPFNMTNGSVERLWLGSYKLNNKIPQLGACPTQLYLLKHDLHFVGLSLSQDYSENLPLISNDDKWPSHFKDAALNNLDYFIFSISRSRDVPFYLNDDALHKRYLMSTISAQKLTKQARIVNAGTGSDQKIVIWEITRTGEGGIWLRNETYTQIMQRDDMTTLASLFCAYSKE